MIEPWPSTKSSSPPRSCPSTSELLGGAGDEVRDDGVDGDPPAGDRDSGLAGGHEARLEPARLRGPVELERDGHLPDRAVRADREHVPGRLLEVGAGRDVQARRRAAQVAQLDAVAAGELAQLLVVGEELVQAVLDVQATLDRGAQQLAPRGREAAAGGGDADEGGLGLEAERVADAADDRDAALRLPRPRRVEDGHDRPLAVGEHAAGGLAVVRVAGEALSEDQERLRHRAPASPRGPAPRRRARRRARDRRRAGGSRPGRRGRRAARRRSRLRSRAPTRSCSRP